MKSKEAGMILKLDMNKAYDRVSWSFLEKVLLKFGFNKGWVAMIMRCISSAWFSVLVNGVVASFFKSKTGLRQGDPLSPYLFVILAEALGRSLSKAIRERKIEGFKDASSLEPMTHL